MKALQMLQNAPHCDLSTLPEPEVAVLRADAATPANEDDRDWMGYRADLSPGQLTDALSGWWRCDPDRVAAGGLLVVTVSEFVVAVLTDLAAPQHNGGTRQTLRYKFTKARLAGWLTDLTDPSAACYPADQNAAERLLVQPLLGARLPSVSGGPIAYVPAGPAAADKGDS
ncbi:DNA-binding protein [Streptacidiphilus anmyonensis]|uniref:DNA-binding protein n=1 Tax=Streptacidiphilus anmyonensis TaxID=405782 RepID=UPI00128D19CF|nr:DNA-binding protein [Streptacidiphilus anmyonensis]